MYFPQHSRVAASSDNDRNPGTLHCHLNMSTSTMARLTSSSRCCASIPQPHDPKWSFAGTTSRYVALDVRSMWTKTEISSRMTGYQPLRCRCAELEAVVAKHLNRLRLTHTLPYRVCKPFHAFLATETQSLRPSLPT
jgi:hypothetical protein